jgi:katanin p60 ATPase-containing subunit A1
MTMRRRIKGLTPDQIKNLPPAEMDKPVSKQDFETAFSKINPSVGTEQLKKYEEWKNDFGSG